MMGIKIGKNCYIGKGVVFDHIYGDLVTLEDNVKIEDDCYLEPFVFYPALQSDQLDLELCQLMLVFIPFHLIRVSAGPARLASADGRLLSDRIARASPFLRRSDLVGGFCQRRGHPCPSR